MIGMVNFRDRYIELLREENRKLRVENYELKRTLEWIGIMSKGMIPDELIRMVGGHSRRGDENGEAWGEA